MNEKNESIYSNIYVYIITYAESRNYKLRSNDYRISVSNVVTLTNVSEGAAVETTKKRKTMSRGGIMGLCVFFLR